MPQSSALNETKNGVVVRSIRNGLVTAIPVVMIGSFALVLKFLPVPAYQNFLATFGSGILPALFTSVNNATFGMLSVYMTVFISMSRAQLRSGTDEYPCGFAVVSLAAFAILSGFSQGNVSIDVLGVKGMFTAVVASTVSPQLMGFWTRRSRSSSRIYSEGADTGFNIAVSVVVPALLTVGTVALFNYALVATFQVSGFHELFVNAAGRVFSNIGDSLHIGLAFVFLSSLMWFFGIHGSNVLEGVSQRILEPGLAINVALAGSGQAPTEIISKTFIDVFVLMGGCGSAMCLLLSLFLFSRNSGSRTLSRIAAIPMLFNINELMIFGLPVVFNRYLFLPFMLTPLLMTLTSYAAIAWGLVPVPCHQVQWTTPILLGGYVATGSVAGSLLQLFNLVLGVFAYMPFIRLHDGEKLRNAGENLQGLVALLKRSEEKRVPVNLMELDGHSGLCVKMLASDLKKAVENGELTLHYQPQFDNGGRCIGSEALLRWNHPTFGMIYPPLVIRLAEDIGILYELEKYILATAAGNAARLRQIVGKRIKTCVNITAAAFYEPSFEAFLQGLLDSGAVEPGDLWLELTEQKALLFDHQTEEKSRRVRAMGFPLVIDDFSMGHTSIRYLQSNEFDMVKLDGSFVRGMNDNPRSCEIVTSIVSLSRALNFTVMGEHVETKEQQELLEKLGCTHYQGYLYSPAIPFDDFLQKIALD